jgi:protein arginine N-methyltransferase 2
VCREWMRHTGWYDRPGVRVLEGRWQDFLDPPKSDSDSATLNHDSQASPSPSGKKSKTDVDIGKFDIVYFDTFQEGYRGHFAFIKHVPRLLRGPSSRFSYFNGHAQKHETQYKGCFTHSIAYFRLGITHLSIHVMFSSS